VCRPPHVSAPASLQRPRPVSRELQTSRPRHPQKQAHSQRPQYRRLQHRSRVSHPQPQKQPRPRHSSPAKSRHQRRPQEQDSLTEDGQDFGPWADIRNVRALSLELPHRSTAKYRRLSARLVDCLRYFTITLFLSLFYFPLATYNTRPTQAIISIVSVCILFRVPRHPALSSLVHLCRVSCRRAQSVPFPSCPLNAVDY
jgi:hypothetical protein